MDATAIEALIGIGAAPALIIALTGHVKRFVRAVQGWFQRSVDEGASPWPLVADAIAVGWAFGLWESGLLLDGIASWTTVVLVGLAVGVAAQLVHDNVPALRGGGTVGS